jgi:hypothetical protein
LNSGNGSRNYFPYYNNNSSQQIFSRRVQLEFVTDEVCDEDFDS